MSKARITRIDGLDDLVRDLERFTTKVMPELAKTSHASAEAMLTNARLRIRNKSGDLYRSLRTKDSALKQGRFFVSSFVTWGDDVREYAAPLELGHKIRNVKDGPVLGHVEQRPFLRPAADSQKRNIRKWMIETLNREIEKLGDKA
jgi:hypothetical protein